MRARFLTGAMIAALVLMAIACGTNNVGTLSDPLHGASGFSLNVINDNTIVGSGAQGFNLTTEDYGRDVVVHVNATGAQNLKALYFDMTYDPAHYRPLIVDSGKAMGTRSDLVCLSIFDKPGKITYGQVLTNWDWRTGYTGDATIASVLFRKMQASTPRTVSKVASDAASQSNLLWDSGTNTLSWFYHNTGDYNQNSKVDIGDLSTLGQKWLQTTATPPWPEADVLSVVDGAANGIINIGDLAPIGINWEKSAEGGYAVYHSASAADYPPSPFTGANGAGAASLATVLFNTATGTANDRKHFTYVVTAPVADDYYWVRPLDGSTPPADGIASTMAGGAPAALTLTLTNPPGSGTGTSGDRYQVNITTDYVFTVFEGATPVTDTAAWVLDPLVGTVTSPGGVLNIIDTYSGDFQLQATTEAGAKVSNILYFTVGVPGADVDIWPDPADTDWAAVTGTGTDVDPYIIPEVVAPGVYPDYTLQADNLAAVGADHSGGAPIALNLLTWAAFPPFIVTWTADGVFQPNFFTSEYVFATLTAAPNTESNRAYVEVHALP